MLGRSSLHQSVTPRLGRRTRSRSPLRPVAGGRGNIHVMRVGGVRADAAVRSGRPAPPRAPSLSSAAAAPGPRVGRSVPTHLLAAGAWWGGWLPAARLCLSLPPAQGGDPSALRLSRRPPPDPFRSVPLLSRNFFLFLSLCLACGASLTRSPAESSIVPRRRGFSRVRALHGCTSGSLFSPHLQATVTAGKEGSLDFK